MATNVMMQCFLVLFFASCLFQTSNGAYNVMEFGAKPDGKTDSTKAFVRAWSSACRSTRAANIYVPKGSFLVKPIVFNGPCKSKILIWIDGQISAPTNYWSFGSSGFWILFYKVSKVGIYGGTIDGRGSGYWACRKAQKVCPPGARSISFVASRNIVVRGLKSLNSQMFHIAIDHGHNILFENIKIRAPSSSPNTDGIHIQSSTGITVKESSFETGDDCISIGPGSTNIWIQGIACGPGHGISVGSLAEHKNEGGVLNVTVTGAVFTGTQNGVRIKSWRRPSSGFAKDIVFQNIIMKNVYNPIIIDQNYCPSGHGCPNQNSGVKISGITYKRIRGTSATKVAMKFECSSSDPCTGIKLHDINLTYYNKGRATSSCSNAHGSSAGIVVPSSCF